MADTLTLVSTTDSADEVSAALIGSAKPATPPAEPPAEPPAPPADGKPAADAAATPPASETPPAADGQPPADGKPVAETPEQKSAREKRMERIQGDIDSLTRRKHDLRRDVEAEEARLTTLKNELTALAAKGIPAGDKPAEPTKPAAAEPVKIEPDRPQPLLADTKPDGTPKYANYEEWVADLAAWNREIARKEADAVAEARLKAYREEREKRDAEDRERIERDSANRAATESLAQHHARIEEFKKAHADFDAALGDVADLVVEMKGDYTRDSGGRPGEELFAVLDKFTLEDSENSAALVYHLAKNPDEMRRIVKLPVAKQIIALSRLDSRLAGAAPPSGPPAKAPTSTKAPEPIKPVGGGPTAPTVPPDEESYEAYKARRNREERLRAGLPVAS